MALVVRKPCRAFHLVDNRIKRAVGVLRRAEVAEPRVRPGADLLHQRRRQPRLADSGLTRD